jgi:serine carboxypeptidase-like clade 2
MLGLLQELGPQLMGAGKTDWSVNTFAWNQNANLLFFESPVGVGFSYYTGDKPVYDDVSTASDNYEALKVNLLLFNISASFGFPITTSPTTKAETST